MSHAAKEAGKSIGCLLSSPSAGACSIRLDVDLESVIPSAGAQPAEGASAGQDPHPQKVAVGRFAFLPRFPPLASGGLVGAKMDSSIAFSFVCRTKSTLDIVFVESFSGVACFESPESGLSKLSGFRVSLGAEENTSTFISKLLPVSPIVPNGEQKLAR